ncbi:MAG: hypothetical protein O7H41_02740 [Planctomycetota bacterium]|nr:hypothetical protein [Planctomycetota bacterium]
MDHGVVGICLIVLYVLFLALPEAIYISITALHSLRYFMSGAVGAAALAHLVFDLWRGADEIYHWEGRVLIGMCLLSPLWFSIGARPSLREVGSHRAKVLRWVNLVGFAISVGLMIHLLVYSAWHWSPGVPISLTTAAVVVLAFSRVVHWQSPTRSRWVGWLPGYPAILLMPAVLVVWALLCTYFRNTWESGPERGPWLIGWGFPLLFYGSSWEPVGGLSGFGFRLIPYLVDLLLAVAVSWVLAWGTDRPVQIWAVLSLRFRRVLRWILSIRFRWTRYLPRFPAVLLVPVVLVLWAGLCSVYRGGPSSWDGGWGVPLRFDGWWPGMSSPPPAFRVTPFLIDLTLALAAAYLMAMAVDRLLFPAIGSTPRRKLRQGDAKEIHSALADASAEGKKLEDISNPTRGES